MNNHSVIRAAAIVFADDFAAINLQTTHRKIVEAIYVDNNNKELDIMGILNAIRGTLGLEFTEQEIFAVVNNSKRNEFDVRHEIKSKNAYVKLTEKRFNSLKEKDNRNNIEIYIQQFVTDEYVGTLSKTQLESAIFKFIYELLNTNISAFRKITSAKNKAAEINVDPNAFSYEERSAINGFLDWDNPLKNQSIFTLLSYSVEYSLLSNNLDSSSFLLHSLRTKVFYLDNNVIFRAVGINGEDRKNRILIFLNKCIASGQKICGFQIYDEGI
jgi:hypothetical protein